LYNVAGLSGEGAARVVAARVTGARNLEVTIREFSFLGSSPESEI
jgi:hypothetical protein